MDLIVSSMCSNNLISYSVGQENPYGVWSDICHDHVPVFCHMSQLGINQ